MNNNDISKFEKVVFVGGINNEYDAEQLSKDYPFAYIVTDSTQQGLEDGILVTNNNELEQENNHSSGNIWKGGQRLTKFINVDSTKNTAQFDAYDLKIDFNQASGLLSFLKVPKIENYKLVTLFYKDSANTIKGYINKNQISSDNINSYLINNVDQSTLDYFDNIFKTEDNTGTKYNLSIINENNDRKFNGYIDSIDNTLYLVLRFESSSQSSLTNINVNTFNINPLNNVFNILTNATELNSSAVLSQITEITDNNILQKLADVTYKYNYKNDVIISEDDIKYGKYIIYKLELKNNSIDTTLDSSTGLYSEAKIPFVFSFVNAANLEALNIGVRNIYVNPISYKLYINDNEVNLTSGQTVYTMPNKTLRCKLEMEPNKIRPLNLHVTLNATGNNFKIANNDSSSIQLNNDGINSNIFTFDINASDYYGWEENISTSIGLEIINNGNVLWSNNVINIKKYMWIGWDIKTIDNGESPFGNIIKHYAVSGKTSLFNTGKIYALFNENPNSDPDTNQKLDITNATTILFGFSDGTQNNSNSISNTGGLPQSPQPNNPEEIIVPFIFRDKINGNNVNAKFWVEYTHKGISINENEVRIQADTIRSIDISNGLSFNDINTGYTVPSIESGASVEIKKINNGNITFLYNNGQSINAYNYLYSTLAELKDDIQIGLKDSALDENTETSPGVPKTNGEGAPYIEITNNKIIYNSDDARERENTIDLRLAYEDPNTNEIIYSNTISFIVKKLIIDWWIYLGEIHTVNRDSNSIVTSYQATIPGKNTTTGKISVPENYTNANPHIINTGEFDENDTHMYGGKLYQYTTNHNYIENTQNPNRKNAFGTWIHLGSTEDMKSIQWAGNTGNNTGTLFSSDGLDSIYGGNSQYMILLVPEILNVADSVFGNISWPWGNVTRDIYKINKGYYKTWIIENQEIVYNEENGTLYGTGLYYDLKYTS